jgi:predicted phage tail protein
MVFVDPFTSNSNYALCIAGKINSDFESLVLQSEWKNYTKSVIKRHNQRETEHANHVAETKVKMEQLQQQAKGVHDKLDEMMNDARSKIAQLEVEVSHDVDRLAKKFEGGTSKSERVCMDDRVKLSQCYNTLRDLGECEVFAKQLEKCVTSAIASA